MITSKVTTPQDAHRRLVLQVFFLFVFSLDRTDHRNNEVGTVGPIAEGYFERLQKKKQTKKVKQETRINAWEQQ